MQPSKPYILLVEDSKIASLMASFILKKLDCLVDMAETGEKAVEMVTQQKYDFIFMDLGLPGIDGLTTTQQIRQIESMNDIPIVALTAHSEDEVRQQCLNAGMVDFIVKPLEEQRAKDILQKHVVMETY